MKLSKTLGFSFALTLFVCQMAQSQLEEHELDLAEKTATVIFECNNCSAENRMHIVGIEKFKFENVEFPYVQEMKLGDYDLIYMPYGPQPGHFPFRINGDSVNVISINAANGQF